MGTSGRPKQSLKDRLSREEFYRLHHEQGISQKNIAALYDISIAYVIRLRKEYDIPTNLNTTKDRSGTTKRKVSLEQQTTPDEIKHLYFDEELSSADIANRFNVSRKTVWKYLKRHGICTRDKTQARRVAIKKGKISQVLYDIDEEFFKAWSAQMAWVLGLMVTDGHIAIGPSGMLVPSLASISLPLLENVRRAMKSNHPIKLVNQTLGGTIYKFEFCRRRLAEDLVALGVTPKKSLIVQFPTIPASYVSHFIRGVFDGDGSVFLEPRSKKSPLRVFFVSGSRDFIEKLEDTLHRNARLRKQTIYSRPEQTSYYFKYGHGDSLKFFEYVYSGSSYDIRFGTKFAKFTAGMGASGMAPETIAMKVMELESIQRPSRKRVTTLMESRPIIKAQQSTGERF